MKDLIAAIYETLFGLYDQTYDLIFSTLYSDGGYIYFSLVFLIIPLIGWALFYYMWRYPYGRWWHWGAWLIIITILVFGITWGIANSEILSSSNEALADAISNPDSGYEAYALTLPIKYAMINAILSLIVGFISSAIMKHFSKVQTHLPL